MDINKPLTEQELDELGEFLLSDLVPENCMFIEMMDGFLTGIAIGPVTIMPSVWLSEIFGESEDDEIIWDSEEQAEEIITLILRHYQSIVAMFDKNEGYFRPIFPEFQGTEIIDEWTMGFHLAIELENEAWEPLINHEDGMALLLPIILYGTPEGWKLLEEEPELKKIPHEDWVQYLIDSVFSIYEFWLPYRSDDVQRIKHAVPKIGRNDPCPCGSGKKFKKCCLNKIPNA